MRRSSPFFANPKTINVPLLAVITVTIGVLTAACKKVPAADSEVLINGQLVSKDTPGAFHTVGLGNCTGTLVSVPDIEAMFVVSAAHCLGLEGLIEDNRIYTQVTFPLVRDAHGFATYVRGSRIANHEGYTGFGHLPGETTYYWDDDGNGVIDTGDDPDVTSGAANDIGLVRLHGAIPEGYSPVELVSAAPAKNARFQILGLGYGGTVGAEGQVISTPEQDSSPEAFQRDRGRKFKWTTAELVEWNPTTSYTGSGRAAIFKVRNARLGTTQTYAGPGDSGGPAFLSESGSLKLAGVVSFIPDQKDSTGQVVRKFDGQAFYMSTFHFRDWIIKTVRAKINDPAPSAPAFPAIEGQTDPQK